MQRKKNLEENKIKQGRNTKEGKSKHCCRHQSTCLIIALLSHRYRSAVAPILLRCCSVVAPLSQRYRTAIVPLLLRHCHCIVALLLHRYRTGITPLSLCCCCSCCRYTVAPLLHRYRFTIALLLSLLLSIRSPTAISPLSLRCHTAVAPAQRGYKQFNIKLLLL